MNTDQLAYEIFVVDPGSYFEMIGEPRSEADHYVFQAVDFKAIERRLDGYFEPKDANRPLHFAEVLFYQKANAYANLFAKVFLKLEQEPARDWRAVIFFESESMLPAVETPYEDLLESKRVKRVFLQTVPEGPKSGFGLAILKLVTKPRLEILRDANLLVKRLRQEIKRKGTQAKLLELIEFVAISKLTNSSKEEVRIMLELDDYRKSRFYQEARKDGIDEGKAEVIHRMASKGFDVKQISDLVGVEVKIVKKVLKSQAP
jgi:predicted transposase YdaD